MIDYKRIESLVAKLETQLNLEAEEEQTIQEQINERTEVEKEQIDVPTPSIEACDEVKEEIIEACEELEAKIDDCESKEACDEVKEEVKTASETVPGVEDEIGDEANGGDPSVSEVVDNNVEVSTDKEVFPTKSEYVAKLQKHIKLAKAVKKSKKMTAEEKKEALQKIEDATKKAKANLNIKKNDFNKILNNDITKILKSSNKINDLSKKGEGLTLNQAIKEMKAWGKDNNVEVDFPSVILNKTIGSCNAAWLIKLGPMIAGMLEKYNSLKKSSDKAE